MSNLSPDSPSVQSYLPILQNVISRMAANSANCKAWSIGLVSAILVLIADKDKPQYVWIAVVPIILFWVLDAHYLALERSFRTAYNSFLKKLHDGKATVDDVFTVSPSGNFPLFVGTLASLVAPSVLLFYVGLAVMIGMAKYLILH